ncbi:MAG: dihydroorotase family protein [Victivallaceae bacterium]
MYIRNVRFLDGRRRDIFSVSEGEDIDGYDFLAIPAVIDGHVHFRTPGYEYKENWETGAAAAIYGGVTKVLDMPDTKPFLDTFLVGKSKEEIVQKQLKAVDIPLEFRFYLGAVGNNLFEIESLPEHKDLFCGVKVCMDASTDSPIGQVNLKAVFRAAAEAEIVVAVHAEDELILRRAAADTALSSYWSPATHSLLRPPEAAFRAVAEVLDLAAKYGTKLYILHVSTEKEIELIENAKRSGVTIFAEAALPHLFFDIRDYIGLGNRAKVNPPLRNPGDREALWEALKNGIVDTVGSSHGPHLQEEKNAERESLAGMPGIQFLLPLLANAVSQAKIDYETLVKLTSGNITSIFAFSPTEDWTLIKEDLEKIVTENEILSKCGWSPYVGKCLVGWPIYTILKKRLYRSGGWHEYVNRR